MGTHLVAACVSCAATVSIVANNHPAVHRGHAPPSTLASSWIQCGAAADWTFSRPGHDQQSLSELPGISACIFKSITVQECKSHTITNNSRVPRVDVDVHKGARHCAHLAVALGPAAPARLAIGLAKPASSSALALAAGGGAAAPARTKVGQSKKKQGRKAGLVERCDWGRARGVERGQGAGGGGGGGGSEASKNLN